MSQAMYCRPTLISIDLQTQRLCGQGRTCALDLGKSEVMTTVQSMMVKGISLLIAAAYVEAKILCINREM